VNASLTAVARVLDMLIARIGMHRIATGHRAPAARWDTAGASDWGLFFSRTLRLENADSVSRRISRTSYLFPQVARTVSAKTQNAAGTRALAAHRGAGVSTTRTRGGDSRLDGLAIVATA
jgi:hypothetical protein